ncbi:hypothetical protein [Methyloceanibacter sp.]|uniref:hypothetical protein n=1 Tax=Methyloceanibacter sp. TaxID=1965321 RepID=UPI00351B5678
MFDGKPPGCDQEALTRGIGIDTGRMLAASMLAVVESGIAEMRSPGSFVSSLLNGFFTDDSRPPPQPVRLAAIDAASAAASRRMPMSPV